MRSEITFKEICFVVIAAMIITLVAINTSGQAGGGTIFGSGSITPGDCASWASKNKIKDAGAPCGAGSGSSLCSASGNTLVCPGGIVSGSGSGGSGTVAYMQFAGSGGSLPTGSAGDYTFAVLGSSNCLGYAVGSGGYSCIGSGASGGGGGTTVTVGYAGQSLAASSSYYLGKVSGWAANPASFSFNSLGNPMTATGNPVGITCASLSGSPPSGGDASLVTTVDVCDATTPSATPTCGTGSTGVQNWTIGTADNSVSGAPTALSLPTMAPGDAWALQINTPAWTSGPYTLYVTCTVKFSN